MTHPREKVTRASGKDLKWPARIWTVRLLLVFDEKPRHLATWENLQALLVAPCNLEKFPAALFQGILCHPIWARHGHIHRTLPTWLLFILSPGAFHGLLGNVVPCPVSYSSMLCPSTLCRNVHLEAARGLRVNSLYICECFCPFNNSSYALKTFYLLEDILSPCTDPCPAGYNF